MRRFRFRLESVLEWRLLQLELEETKLQGLFEELRRVDGALDALDAGKAEAERAVLGGGTVPAQQLEALDAHRLHLAREKQRLAAARVGCEGRIAAQREQVRKAERDLRLLEKLKERRQAEWRKANDREQEALAAEVFLAQWHRKK